MDAGVLPVKALDRAKERLSTHFGPAERRRIAEALFEDALDLCESSDFLSWWIVSDDDGVRLRAQERGFAVLADDGSGLNPALARALEATVDAGADSVTVIPCDTPLAFRGDLVDLLDTGATSDMVVVPSEKDGGTNGLYLEPPDLVEPNFGQGSLRRHLDIAEKASLRCALLSLPRLALDIDTVEDVRDYLAKPKHAATRTAAVLEELQASIAD